MNVVLEYERKRVKTNSEKEKVIDISERDTV